MNTSIKKHDSYNAPIKAKEDLIFHVGFCQFVARSIFSSDAISSDKHKMERFLHAGCFSIASVFAPISFPPLPIIVLKNGDGEVTPAAVAAVGSLRSIDLDRIILKKIILTGYICFTTVYILLECSRVLDFLLTDNSISGLSFGNKFTCLNLIIDGHVNISVVV